MDFEFSGVLQTALVRNGHILELFIFEKEAFSLYLKGLRKYFKVYPFLSEFCTWKLEFWISTQLGKNYTYLNYIQNLYYLFPFITRISSSFTVRYLFDVVRIGRNEMILEFPLSSYCIEFFYTLKMPSFSLVILLSSVPIFSKLLKKLELLKDIRVIGPFWKVCRILFINL